MPNIVRILQDGAGLSALPMGIGTQVGQNEP